MFFGIKREKSCFFIGYESVEIRSFVSNECNARPLVRKKRKIFSDALSSDIQRLTVILQGGISNFSEIFFAKNLVCMKKVCTFALANRN